MYVRSVQLDNLKLFKSLSFDFERSGGKYAGWTVFVGGNSSGKSTLLKAMALALMGPEVGGRLMGAPRGWIAEGEKRASANVGLAWDKECDQLKGGGRPPGETFEAGVRWTQENVQDEVPQFRSLEKRNARGGRIQTAERGPWSPNAPGWFAAAYGPMRRLSGGSSESMRYTMSKEAGSRFVTLFREDAALSESEEWLRRMYARSLESNGNKADIERILGGVRALLEDGLLPQGMMIERISVDHVFIRDGHGVELPMREISDGCRSIYATILDLVHSLCDEYGVGNLFEKNAEDHTVINKPGVVIIDEIEAHLHPAWQRLIPEWLKQHFPAIQFLVSTHSPLIAQAADENGLFILPVQDDLNGSPRAATKEEYERIRLGTAHKTVLGVAFGLDSTRTRWAESRMTQWQNLNAKKKARVPLSPAENKEFKVLERQMELAFGEQGE